MSKSAHPLSVESGGGAWFWFFSGFDHACPFVRRTHSLGHIHQQTYNRRYQPDFRRRAEMRDFVYFVQLRPEKRLTNVSFQPCRDRKKTSCTETRRNVRHTLAACSPPRPPVGDPPGADDTRRAVRGTPRARRSTHAARGRDSPRCARSAAATPGARSRGARSARARGRSRRRACSARGAA